MPGFVTPSASAVILAAGKGTRAPEGRRRLNVPLAEYKRFVETGEKSELSVPVDKMFRRDSETDGLPKQFRDLAGKPLLAHCLEAFEKCEQIREIIIAAPKEHLKRTEEIADGFGISKAKVIAGGETRFESARLGFEKTGEDAMVVVFHDAARPFVDAHRITGTVVDALQFGAAISAIAVDDTVKKTHMPSENLGDRYVKETVARDEMLRAQTPQAFRRELLADAYGKFSGNGAEIGDEAALFERTGGKVITVPGDKRNMKITVEEDFVIAEAIAESVKRGDFEELDLFR